MSNEQREIRLCDLVSIVRWNVQYLSSAVQKKVRVELDEF